MVPARPTDRRRFGVRNSKFTIRFPVARLQHREAFDGSAAGRDAMALDPPAVGSQQLSGVRVLVVDDDGDALLLMQEILESAGARVAIVSSAAAALEYLRQHELPDLLLADIGMPEMDGFAMIAQIRGSSDLRIRAMPAIALTAYARSEDRRRALVSGYQTHLAKPISPPELIAAIRALGAEWSGTRPLH